MQQPPGLPPLVGKVGPTTLLTAVFNAVNKLKQPLPSALTPLPHYIGETEQKAKQGGIG